MEALYHHTNKMVHEIQNQLGRLERAVTAEENGDIQNDIQARIDQMVSNCERLEMMVNKEPPSRRATAKLRVDQLKYDCQHLQAAMRNVLHRKYQRDEEERERDALMSREFAPNDASRSHGVSGDTSILIDAALTQHQRVSSAHKGVDQLIDTGANVLASLRDQRGTLKGVQRRMLDVMNTLGLSNTVMRLIDKRSNQDRFILFGGMIVTCIIMFLVWKYLV
jgi:Golgi SNAP receptor complex protein 2